MEHFIFTSVITFATPRQNDLNQKASTYLSLSLSYHVQEKRFVLIDCASQQ